MMENFIERELLPRVVRKKMQSLAENGICEFLLYPLFYFPIDKPPRLPRGPDLIPNVTVSSKLIRQQFTQDVFTSQTPLSARGYY